MDVSPKQLVSVRGAHSVPGERRPTARYGSNMQRSGAAGAAEAPFVAPHGGRGARDSAPRSGTAYRIVDQSTPPVSSCADRGSDRPTGRRHLPADEVPALNQNTCINQRRCEGR